MNFNLYVCSGINTDNYHLKLIPINKLKSVIQLYEHPDMISIIDT